MNQDSESPPVTGLVVNHSGERCGVYQFGRRLFDAMSMAGDIKWGYQECGCLDDLLRVNAEIGPDVIVLNHVPFTMPWATAENLRRCPAKIFSVFHEAFQAAADALTPEPFLRVLCPDPTLVPANPIALPVPRFIPPPYAGPRAEPATFTIGSFGFAYRGKGFDTLCGLVCEQFDEAVVRLNLPFHDSEAMVSKAQIDSVIAACRARLTKPGLRLEVTHDFLDEDALLAFLAGNTINAFLYESSGGRGISSCTDYALSSGRPIAISRSTMFRHLHGINPSICVEDRSLRAIAEAGTAPLRHHCDAYDMQAAGHAWNLAIRKALDLDALARCVPDGRGFNKLLNDRSRDTYGAALSDLQRYAPEMLSRKIPRANIQQAFTLDTAERFIRQYPEARILAVGSYEDTAVATLRAKGYRLDEIDPNVNGLDLQAFYGCHEGAHESYDVILCISVLEHVEDDVTFVQQISELLAPDGIAIFTVDFSNRYPEHGRRPGGDFRLYTSNDLRDRLMRALPTCALLDPPSWDEGDDDFDFNGYRYAFATWVFRRLSPEQARYAAPAAKPWRRSLAACTAEAASLRAQLQADQATIAAHEAEIAELTRQNEQLRGMAAAGAKLQSDKDLLYRELRLETGPRSLRMVIPIARMIRKVAGTKV